MLREALRNSGGLAVAGDLIDQLEAMGQTRAQGASMISRGVSVGLLERVGQRRPFSYRVDAGYDRHVRLAEQARLREGEDGSRQLMQEVKPNDGLNLPAYGGVSLAPHLGTPVGDEDELAPVVGHAYRDTARRMFERAFSGVE